MDERVLAVLKSKDQRQDALMEAVKARIAEIEKTSKEAGTHE
jgi:hypothetical protein